MGQKQAETEKIVGRPGFVPMALSAQFAPYDLGWCIGAEKRKHLWSCVDSFSVLHNTQHTENLNSGGEGQLMWSLEDMCEGMQSVMGEGGCLKLQSSADPVNMEKRGEKEEVKRGHRLAGLEPVSYGVVFRALPYQPCSAPTILHTDFFNE
jgi:hypothetical protein